MGWKIIKLPNGKKVSSRTLSVLVELHDYLKEHRKREVSVWKWIEEYGTVRGDYRFRHLLQAYEKGLVSLSKSGPRGGLVVKFTALGRRAVEEYLRKYKKDIW